MISNSKSTLSMYCIEEQTAEKTIDKFAFCKKDYTYLYLSVLSRNKTAVMNDVINSK